MEKEVKAINIRIPEKLKLDTQIYCLKNGISFNSFAFEAIEKLLKERNKEE